MGKEAEYPESNGEPIQAELERMAKKVVCFPSHFKIEDDLINLEAMVLLLQDMPKGPLLAADEARNRLIEENRNY